MLHPHVVETVSTISGRGLRATRRIPKGTVVWHPCRYCTRFTARSVSTFVGSEALWIDRYGYTCTDGSAILPCRAAFTMNHSCEATVLDYSLDFGIAVRDIEAGDEVTLDYRTFACDSPWVMQCRCGTSGCGRVIRNDLRPPDLEKIWNDRVADAIRFISSVEQPLEESLLLDSVVYRTCQTYSQFRERQKSSSILEAAKWDNLGIEQPFSP